MAARPVLGSTITAGAYFEIVTVWDADSVLLAIERTTSGYFPAARVGGIWALICPAEVSNSGSGLLFKVTQTPPRIFGNGLELDESDAARFVPMMAAMPSGAKAVW